MTSVEELVAAVNSGPVQRFLGALREIPEEERGKILDQVLSGPPSTRVDLGLPAGMTLSRRLIGGPDCEFAISKRDPQSGAQVTVFVTLTPTPGRTVRRVLAWNPGEN